MADHGEVEYATADGNDYAEHEGTYERFLHLTVIGIMFVISIVIGLAIGGVADHWGRAAAVMIVAAIVAAHGMMTGVQTPSAVMATISLLVLAASTVG